MKMDYLLDNFLFSGTKDSEINGRHENLSLNHKSSKALTYIFMAIIALSVATSSSGYSTKHQTDGSSLTSQEENDSPIRIDNTVKISLGETEDKTSPISTPINEPEIPSETITEMEPENPPISDENELPMPLTNKPVSLLSLNNFSGNDLERVVSFKDNFGELHNNVIKNRYGQGEFEASYKIDGKYKRLSFTLYLPEHRKNAENDTCCYVYGDDELIFAYESQIDDRHPVVCDVDITGVTELKIVNKKSNRILGMPMFISDAFLDPVEQEGGLEYGR